MGTSSYGIAGLRTTYPDLKIGGYQRSSCWEPSLKASFIRSIINDWPTGIIVLNKIQPQGNAVKLYASHDIIDGQQRLTTIFEFLENPFIYFLSWAPKPGPDEHLIMKEIRDEFETLIDKIKTSSPRKKKDAIRKEIFDEVGQEILKKAANPQGATISQPTYARLVEKVWELYTTIAQRTIVVHDLEADTAKAEKMYLAINTQSKPVLWWALLRAQDYNRVTYESSSTYSVRYSAVVDHLSRLYYAKNKVLPRDIPNPPSIWAALYALGEYYQACFRGEDPSLLTQPIQGSSEKVNVDGFGFRLLVGFLSHEVGRAAINDVFDNYSVPTICRAIDCLFDTADALFKHPSSFQLFKKYSKMDQDLIPAYPLMCIIIASAHLLASNPTPSIAIPQQVGIRKLTEELFAETLCTSRWSGSGDSKMKEWLDKYFISSIKDGPRPPSVGILNQAANPSMPFPGGIKQFATGQTSQLWTQKLGSLTDTGTRNITKDWQYFHFVIQYLFDSRVRGCLPTGSVWFDHIVPFSQPQFPATTNPLNFCAISKDLNMKKGAKTYSAWNPNGLDKANYELQCLNNVQVNASGIAPLPQQDFLVHANISDLALMINERRAMIQYAINVLLPYWVNNGD